MRDTIRLFLLPPEQAKGIIRQRGIEYVAICPGGIELRSYVKASRNGLAAALLTGSAPRWLQPLTAPDSLGLRIWRVNQDLLGSITPTRAM